MTFFSKLIAAFLFSVIAFFVSAPITVQIVTGLDFPRQHGLILGLIAAAGIAIICLIAPSARKAWGHGSLIAGLLFIIAPFSAKRLLGPAAAQMQTAVDELLSQAPVVDADTTFTITSAKVVPAASGPSTAFFVIGTIFILFGLALLIRKRQKHP